MIRQDTDYALRMLATIAEKAPDGIATSDLAAQTQVPHGYAQKILRQLAHAGILVARTGRRGGFSLHRAPSQVTFSDVIASIQGPLTLNRCSRDPSDCVRSNACRVYASLSNLQSSIDQLLSATTLADLMLPGASPVRTRPVRRPRAQAARS